MAFGWSSDASTNQGLIAVIVPVKWSHVLHCERLKDSRRGVVRSDGRDLGKDTLVQRTAVEVLWVQRWSWKRLLEKVGVYKRNNKVKEPMLK